MIEWLGETLGNPYLIIVVLTLVPTLELRASIPYGILVADVHWAVVVVLAIVVNILLGPILYEFLDKTMHLLHKIPVFGRLWDRLVARAQKRVHRMVEKYGIWGLGLFIGVPLPGSGVYTGAMGGYLLGFTRKEFYVATVMGVLIAAVAVTAVVLTGAETFDFFLKQSHQAG